MIYSPEETLRLHRLLDAFHDYLENREDYDVVFSEKIGYVRLIVAPDSDHVFFPIGGFDDLLEMLILDHLQDEEERTENRMQIDLCRVKERLLPLFHSLGPDTAYAIQVMELLFALWQSTASPRPRLTLLPRR